MTTTIAYDQLADLAGTDLGYTEYRTVTQDQVNLFADATDDHQWIHLDQERAAAGPYGGTIAHGYLTLSLIPALVGQLYRVGGVRMGINYGLNRVRFPAPVRVGSAVRVVATIDQVTPFDGGAQLVATVTVQNDGGDKPVCVAETVSRLYTDPPR